MDNVIISSAESSILDEIVDNKDKEDVESSEESMPYFEEEAFFLQSADDVTEFYNRPFNIRCLGEVELSRSSLLKDPFWICPAISDPNLSAILWTPPEPKQYDDVGIERYYDLCKLYSTPIIKKFVQALTTKVVDLECYGLVRKSARAVLETLTHNIYVETCNVSDNGRMDSACGKYIKDLLQYNMFLQELNLKRCGLEAEGTILLCEGLKKARITHLDLSRNNIEDDGAAAIAVALNYNTTLTHLNLSHNNLTSKAGVTLGESLEVNFHLKSLDLSWNYINEMTGTKPLFEGLKNNRKQKLSYLNMAWNGLTGVPGGGPVGSYITNSKGLEVLDLSFNRLYGKAIEYLVHGILHSSALKTLHLTNNPLSNADIESIIEAYGTRRKLSLHCLDLTNHYFDKINKPNVEKILKWGKELKFIGYLSDFEIVGPNYEEVLLERCKAIAETPSKGKKKKQPPPFGQFFYEIEREYIPKFEFREWIDSWGVPKIATDEPLLREIETVFVDQGKMHIGQMRDVFLKLYPDTPRPPPKPEPEPEPEPIVIEEPPPPPPPETGKNKNK